MIEKTFQYIAAGGRIATGSRNPYEQDTPEHQLWEHAKAANHSAMSHEKQSQQHAEWAAGAHLRAQKYLEALGKLDGSGSAEKELPV